MGNLEEDDKSIKDNLKAGKVSEAADAYTKFIKDAYADVNKETDVAKRYQLFADAQKLVEDEKVKLGKSTTDDSGKSDSTAFQLLTLEAAQKSGDFKDDPLKKRDLDKEKTVHMEDTIENKLQSTISADLVKHYDELTDSGATRLLTHVFTGQWGKGVHQDDLDRVEDVLKHKFEKENTVANSMNVLLAHDGEVFRKIAGTHGKLNQDNLQEALDLDAKFTAKHAGGQQYFRTKEEREAAQTLLDNWDDSLVSQMKDGSWTNHDLWNLAKDATPGLGIVRGWNRGVESGEEHGDGWVGKGLRGLGNAAIGALELIPGLGELGIGYNFGSRALSVGSVVAGGAIQAYEGSADNGMGEISVESMLNAAKGDKVEVPTTFNLDDFNKPLPLGDLPDVAPVEQKKEEPKVEPIKVEPTPIVEHKDPVKVVHKATHTHNANVPKADVPKADVPKADVPKADVPKADVPKADVPKADVPKADVPKADVPAANTDVQPEKANPFRKKPQ